MYQARNIAITVYNDLLKGSPDPEELAKDLDLHTVEGRKMFWTKLRVHGGLFIDPLLAMTPRLVLFLYSHKELLRPNRSRPISQSSVQQYANEIKDGYWVQGGGTSIIIDEYGRLAGGFGRLQAVTEANQGIVVRIRMDVTEREIGIIDNTAANTIQDRVAIRFSVDRKMNVSLLTKTVAVIRDYLFSRVTPRNKSTKLLETLVDHHLDAWKKVWGTISRSAKYTNFRQTGVLAAFVYHIADAQYRGNKAREDALLDLWSRIIQNSALMVDSPPHSMYTRITLPRSHSREAQMELMQWMMHGIDAHISGRSLKFSSMSKKKPVLDTHFRNIITRIG